MLNQQNLTRVFDREFRDLGENYKANCPFHDERTPSFYVHKEQLIANCFGCGVHGYIDTLAARYLGVDRVQAAQALDIKLQDVVGAKTSKSRRARRKSPTIYPESWLAPWKREVHRYVLERGLDLHTLKRAEVRFDQVYARQVFPHRDTEGRLVGAIGRSCRGQIPKWFFYWDYDKGRHLYQPVPPQSTDGRCPLIIVEGVFDVLWLYQNGFHNVAATLGTKITKDQVKQIAAASDDVILAYDNDESGAHASMWLYSQLRGPKVRFVEWPEQTNDVMDLDKEGIECMMQNSSSYLQWKLKELSKNLKTF